MPTFAERVKETRKKAKMSQTEFADALGTTLNTVSKWERGLHEPSFGMITRISQRFKVSALYLDGKTDADDCKEVTEQDIAEADYIDDVTNQEAEIRGKTMAAIARLLMSLCEYTKVGEMLDIAKRLYREASDVNMLQDPKLAIRYTVKELDKSLS